MPSKSKAQQKFMGAVYALKKGDIKPSDVTPAVRKVAKDMKKSDAKDFASTKHKGLPKKVKQEIIKRLKQEGEIHMPQVGSYAIPSKLKKRKHKDTDNLGKRNKNGNSGQPDLEEGFKSEYQGNDNIIWKKGKTRNGVTNFTPYYKGHNIDKGGHNFKTEKDLKDFIKDYILSNQLYNKYRFEGVFSTIDQIRQDSKNVRDFVKNVFADKDFAKMKNDKEFIKYLKSVYEGVNEGSFQLGTKAKPPLKRQGLNHHILTKSKPRRKYHDDDANFKKKDSGQEDLDEKALNELGIFPISNYIKGMIPSKMLNTVNRNNKEKFDAVVDDLIRTLNHFWKKNNIPYRVRKR